MLEQIAKVIVFAFYAYALIGLVFAVAFVAVGVKRIDAQAVATSLGFRLLIFPGCVAFWPMLLRRWLRGRTEPPVEENPHR
jgi:membrane protein implicated in regulation of membrane protease activity